MDALQKAITLLHTGGYTCVWHKDGQTGTTSLRGVRPLVLWLRDGAVPPGACAADKVIGKATAFLYVLLGVQAVYGDVVSESALQVLQSHGITVQYGQTVPHIINRQGDGICPFEAAVRDCTTPQEALPVIHNKMDQLGIPR